MSVYEKRRYAISSDNFMMNLSRKKKKENFSRLWEERTRQADQRNPNFLLFFYESLQFFHPTINCVYILKNFFITNYNLDLSVFICMCVYIYNCYLFMYTNIIRHARTFCKQMIFSVTNNWKCYITILRSVITRLFNYTVIRIEKSSIFNHSIYRMNESVSTRAILSVVARWEFFSRLVIIVVSSIRTERGRRAPNTSAISAPGDRGLNEIDMHTGGCLATFS